MSKDLEIRAAAHGFFEILQGPDRDILHLAAVYATYMIMVCRRPIEPSAGAGQVQLPGQAPLGEDFEVTIHGTEAYPGHPFSNRFVDLIGSGMGIQIPEFFENNPSLPGHPESFFSCHHLHQTYNIMRMILM